ncbi:phosphotransferase [Cucumibacter marinus]|uniref:phosphotransferase n=1 Tax=Cucumibacter marinus TaxID=1121252 RepID=UPI0004244C54|nr:phosphotransferase [Cucumibacter marinus]
MVDAPTTAAPRHDLAPVKVSGGIAGWILRRTRLASLAGNGLALVLAVGISSVLGLLYWMVAARLLSPAEAGIGATLVATMMGLSHAAQLNLRNIAHRFLPASGRDAPRLIRRLYALAGVVAIVLGLGFVFGAGHWAEDLAFVSRSPLVASVFIAALVVWTLYSMQEAILTGLRLSGLVPVQTLTYAIAKILLVFALVLWVSQTGLAVLAAWVIPAAVLGLVVHRMARHELSQGEVWQAAPTEVIDRGHFFRFFGWDYAGSLATSIALAVVPMLVISISGAAASAHYQIAWSIAYSLYLVGRQLGAALQAEAALYPDRRQSIYASTFAYALALVVPACLALLVFAPWIMLLFGEAYVDQGSHVLRIFALAAVPLTLVTVGLAVARAEKAYPLLTLVQVLTLIATVGLGAVWLQQFGVGGMAWAWLAAHTIALAFMVLYALRRTGVAALPAFGIAFVDASIGAVRMVLTRLNDLRGGRMFNGHPAMEQGLSGASVQRVTRDGRPIVEKQATTPRAITALKAESNALQQLRSDVRSAAPIDLLPQWLGFDLEKDDLSREIKARLAMSAMPGKRVHPDAERAVSVWQAAARAVAALRQLQNAIPGSRATPDTFAYWVHDAMDELRKRFSVRPDTRAGRCLAPMEQDLAQLVRDHPAETGLGHGDFCLDNVLFDPETGDVSAIVDWGQLRMDAPVWLDPLFMILVTRSNVTQSQFGVAVADLLRRPVLTGAEAAMLDDVRLASDPRLLRAAVLLAWVHHIAANTGKSESYRAQSYWSLVNFNYVVRAYDHVR